MGLFGNLFRSSKYAQLFESTYLPIPREGPDPNLEIPGRPNSGPLSTTEVKALAELEDAARERGLLDSIDAIVELAQATSRDDKRMIAILGVALGTHLSQQIGFAWAQFADEYGVAAIVTGDAGPIRNLSIFPAREIFIRLGDDAASLPSFLKENVERIERFRRMQ